MPTTLYECATCSNLYTVDSGFRCGVCGTWRCKKCHERHAQDCIEEPEEPDQHEDEGWDDEVKGGT